MHRRSNVRRAQVRDLPALCLQCLERLTFGDLIVIGTRGFVHFRCQIRTETVARRVRA